MKRQLKKKKEEKREKKKEVKKKKGELPSLLLFSLAEL